MNQKTKNKLFMHSLLVLASVALFVGILSSPMVYAAEKTGRIISELINNVGNEMDRLETFVEKNQNDTKDFNKVLDQKYEAFMESKSENETEKIKADILLYSGRVNECQTKEVQAYMDTISNLIPMMDRLNTESQKLSNRGFKSREAFGTQKEHVRNSLVNSSRLCQQLKRMSGKNAIKGVQAIEQAIVSLSTMYSDKGIKPGEEDLPFKGQVANLENTYSMLQATKQELLKERFLLRRDNLTQLARLGAMRLYKGKTNVNSITQIPGHLRKSIEKRRQRYMSVMHTDKSNNLADTSYTQSHENDAIIDRIASGNAFDE